MLIRGSNITTAAPIFRIESRRAGSIRATKDHAARAGLRAGMHVLDLGCGLGGSSRYLAAACGCNVSAIDLTPKFVELARLLTMRCGLSEKID
jgi:cyclopropane fatty-acyl-phospholipid synthase-like methyltransferase